MSHELRYHPGADQLALAATFNESLEASAAGRVSRLDGGKRRDSRASSNPSGCSGSASVRSRRQRPGATRSH
jgi:hypothetical protein